MPGYTVREVSLLKYFDKEIPFNHLPNYFTNIYFLDVEKLREEFINKKLLTYTNLEETISFYTVAQMKTFCKENSIDIKLSGKKDDLIKRLLENVDHSVLEDYFNVKRYKLTAIGELLVSKHLSDIIKLKRSHHFDVLRNNPNLLKLIENQQYSQAVAEWRKNPEKLYSEYETIYQDFYKRNIPFSSPDAEHEKLIKNIAMVADIIAVRHEDATVILEEAYNIVVPETTMFLATRVLDSLFAIHSFQENFKKGLYKTYRITALSGDSTCTHCVRFRNKDLPIEKAEIGVNFPPFYGCTSKLCRCTADLIDLNIEGLIQKRTNQL